MLKNGRGLLDYGTRKLGLSHKWFDKFSRLIKWFLDADSDQIIFGLVTNLPSIFDIYLVSTTVTPVKNDVLFLMHWKIAIDFTEILVNYGLKRRTVCKTVRFISQFFLKLYIQLWTYFHSMVLGRIGREYCKKIRC